MQQLHLPQNLLTIIADPSTNSPPTDPIAMQLMTDYEEHDGTNQEQEMAQLITVVPTIDLQEPTCSKYLDDGKSASSNDNVTDENQSPNKRVHQTEVQKSCKKQATCVMKFRSFEVNWEKVSDNLLDRLNSLQEYRAKNSTAVPRSMRFKKTELICLVNSVVDQMRCIDTRIRADVMETVAQQILRKYPCLEILDDDGFSNGLSHITIKQKMINRNTYLNRIDNDVPKVKQLTEEFRNRRAGTMKEYWNVSTDQCSKEILSKLRRDEPALLTAEFLMASQGFVRSRLDQKKDLSSIVSEFPVLRRRQLLSFHFKQATGIEIDMLRKYYDSKKAKIVGYSATQKTHALCETSTDYDVFNFLAKLLDENLDGLVLKKEIGTRIDEFRDEIAGPLLLCIDTGNGSLYYVYADNARLTEGTHDFLNGMQDLMCIQYVYSLMYTKSATKLLELVQEYFLKIFPAKGSKSKAVRVGKQQRTVRQVIAALSQFAEVDEQNESTVTD
ncbi:uncharacterized protein LOC134286823 [Aedes albopictus]|uniref:ERCC4 domain-containing protein n=1 Tax=Aedes albopictus TaxID=7160 RepID=A0ABM1XPX4_AEDAL